jgi:hypothetical protein
MMRRLLVVGIVAIAGTALAAPTTDPAFLPIETRCANDADCAITTRALDKETYECCSWCRPTAGTKTWVARVESICAAKIRGGFQPMCAPWDCVAPPKPVCRAGTCSASY